MRVSEELMDWMLAKTEKSEEQAKEVVTLLDQLQNIRETKLACDKAKEVAQKSYQKTLQEISDREYMNCKKCPHPVSTYHADASGNNDSHHDCDLCGYTW